MRTSPHNPWLQVALTFVLTVGALAVLASAVDMDPPATASAGHEPAAARQGLVAEPGVQPPDGRGGHGADATARLGERLQPTRLDDLACFRCHGLQEYEHGERFPHATHREEGAGHCHRCHAFQGHFEVVIRKETCEECH